MFSSPVDSLDGSESGEMTILTEYAVLYYIHLTVAFEKVLLTSDTSRYEKWGGSGAAELWGVYDKCWVTYCMGRI